MIFETYNYKNINKNEYKERVKKIVAIQLIFLFCAAECEIS